MPCDPGGDDAVVGLAELAAALPGMDRGDGDAMWGLYLSLLTAVLISPPLSLAGGWSTSTRSVWIWMASRRPEPSQRRAGDGQLGQAGWEWSRRAGRSVMRAVIPESEGFGQYQPQGQGNQNRHQYTQCHALVCDAAPGSRSIRRTRTPHSA